MLQREMNPRKLKPGLVASYDIRPETERALLVLALHKFVTCVAWWLSGRALDVRFTGCGFNSRPVRFHVIQVNSALHPSWVAKLSTCFG